MKTLFSLLFLLTLAVSTQAQCPAPQITFDITTHKPYYLNQGAGYTMVWWGMNGQGWYTPDTATYVIQYVHNQNQQNNSNIPSTIAVLKSFTYIPANKNDWYRIGNITCGDAIWWNVGWIQIK